MCQRLPNPTCSTGPAGTGTGQHSLRRRRLVLFCVVLQVPVAHRAILDSSEWAMKKGEITAVQGPAMCRL